MFGIPKTPQIEHLRIAMLRRGMSITSLAKRLGVAQQTLSNAIFEGFSANDDGVLREKIEDALQMPIWSSLAEFNEKRRLAEQLGFNPHTMKTRELMKRARLLGITGCHRKQRDVVLKRFVESTSSVVVFGDVPIPGNGGSEMLTAPSISADGAEGGTNLGPGKPK